MFNFIPQRNLHKNSVFLTILFLAATRHKSVCMIVPGYKQVVLGLKHFVLGHKQSVCVHIYNYKQLVIQYIILIFAQNGGSKDRFVQV